MVQSVITKCSLAAITNSYKPPTPAATEEANKKNWNIHPSRRPNTSRPPILPPPTVLPLRHCNHKRQTSAAEGHGDGDGNEEDVTLSEEDCLLSLLCPNEELKRNKEHFILASADPILSSAQKREVEEQQKNPRRRPRKGIEAPPPPNDIRRKARQIPGVPIIYVKRSVMVLEPLSGGSEQIREGLEKGKLRSGLVSKEAVAAAGKRKRDDGDAEKKPGRPLPKGGKVKKAKGPNPLSAKKPKKRDNSRSQGAKRGRGGGEGGGGDGGSEKKD